MCVCVYVYMCVWVYDGHSELTRVLLAHLADFREVVNNSHDGGKRVGTPLHGAIPQANLWQSEFGEHSRHRLEADVGQLSLQSEAR